MLEGHEVTDAFCRKCGAALPQPDYPRRCGVCGLVCYGNPPPVSVILVPVTNGPGSTGLLTIRRAIQPGQGLLALPGGFVERTDMSAEAAAVRELKEETGLDLPSEMVRLDHSFIAPDALIIFARALKAISVIEIQSRQSSENEVSAIRVIYEPTTLAFASHTAAAGRFFTRLAAEKP